MKTPQKWEPREYQKDGVQWCLSKLEEENCAALFLKPGLGKTTIALEVFRQLKMAGKAKTCLVVAPLKVIQLVWPDEIQKWLNFYDLTYTTLHGARKEENLKKKVDIYLINYEGLPWLVQQYWTGSDLLVFDELTKMKSWSAGRVKLFKPFLPSFKYRIGLTGTPMPKNLEDLFSQIFMLDRGKRLGTRITHYREAYFFPYNALTRKRELLPGSFEIIAGKIKDLAFRVDEKKVLALPEDVYNVIKLQLPQALRAQYKHLAKEFIVQLAEQKYITAMTAATLSMKLRQFLSGNVYINKNVTAIHTHKLEALKDFVEDTNGQPLFIAYHFKHEVDMILKALPQARALSSELSSKEANLLKDRWNNKQIEVLLGHPQSVSYGLNLQEGGSNILFYSLDFNAEHHEQFIRRLSRQGQQASHVVVNYLIYEKTIEEYILAVLSGRSELQQAFLDFITFTEADSEALKTMQ